MFRCTSAAEAGLNLTQSLRSAEHKNESLRRMKPKAEKVPMGFSEAAR